MALNTSTITHLSKSLCVDRRSIMAELEGRFVRGRAGERIRAAFAALEIQHNNSASGVAEISRAQVSQTQAQKHTIYGTEYNF